jgi:FkbM family methyltransferase
MKKIGDWFIPDFDNPDKLKFLESNDIQCRPALEKAFKHVKKFDNAIDVGAWIGDSTSIILTKFKHVKVFEPVIEIAECCKTNLLHQELSNFEIFLVGLSNKSGKQMLVNKGKSFSGFIPTVELNKYKRSFEIETNTLDFYNFEDIDFIKIDVDSHEGFMLEGTTKFFKNNNPVIMIESKERDQKKFQNNKMLNPIDILTNIGYKIKETAGKAEYILTR